MTVFVALLCAVPLLACQPTPPLANTQPSRQALAAAVLDAVARRDIEALRARR